MRKFKALCFFSRFLLRFFKSSLEIKIRNSYRYPIEPAYHRNTQFLKFYRHGYTVYRAFFKMRRMLSTSFSSKDFADEMFM